MVRASTSGSGAGRAPAPTLTVSRAVTWPRWLPAGTHDYDKFIKPSELTRWCRAADLKVIDMTGMVYNPLTKDYSLKDNDVDVNYLVATVKEDI